MFIFCSSFSFFSFSGNNQDILAPIPAHKIATTATPAATGIPGVPTSGVGVGNNNLNINLPENNNAILRLEVELRDKNAPKYRRAVGVGVPAGAARGGRGGIRGAAHNRPAAVGVGGVKAGNNINTMMDLKGNAIVPLEKVNISKNHVGISMLHNIMFSFYVVLDYCCKLLF